MHPYHHAQSQPDKVAYVMAESGETVTYRQLDERSNQFAHLLRSAGLQPGDHMAILMENHPRFFEICWGAQRAGIIYTAISTRLKLNEAAYIVNNCAARLMIASVAQAELAQALLPHMTKVAQKLVVDGELTGYQSFERSLAQHPPTPIADETAGADMLYSSGTTGYPKGVFVPPESPEIDASNSLVEICRGLYGMGPQTVYLSPAPLYHAAPMRFCMTAMRLGGTCVVMAHFEPEAYLAQIEKHQVTHTQVVPTMFVRLLKLPAIDRAKYDLSSLKFAIHAAAPCPVPIKEQMIEWWGPVIWEYYAGTEGNGMTMVRSQDWLTHKGTVGKAVIGKLRICDDEGHEMPIGETGTVYFADGKVFSYHGDPGKTAASTNAQGWTTLGDVGYVDGEGYLYLTDRKAYMIISGGVNIYPQEVENLLVTHPKVYDVAVLGVPNDEFGEEVKAVVQPVDMNEAGPALAAELIAFCHAHLSSIKCPKTVDFEHELPRHPTGKLYKRLLKDRYWAGHNSKIL
jgi:long-chain acyl-CoA synthetase